MALLASITMLSQLQEVCICYHVALVIHIVHAFLVKYLHTCSALASYHVSVLHSHLGLFAHHNNQQTRQVRLRPSMHVQGP